MHLYSGVCVMQVCNVCVHVEDQMGTQCTIHVQKAWYTNLHRISGLYKHAQVQLN